MLNRLLIILAFYLPFQLALNPSAGVDLASIRVLIILLFFLWLAECLRRRQIIIANNLLTRLILSFLAISLFSLCVAKNTDWAVRKLLFLFSVFPVYFVVSGTEKKLLETKKIAKALVFSGAILALVGIFQFLAQFVFGLEKVYKFWANFVIWPFLGKSFSLAVFNNPSWLVNISGNTYLRATAFFPDPHMLSFYLGLLFPAAFMSGVAEKKPGWIMLSAIILAADLLTFSRGGYLGILAGILALVFYFWRRIENKLKIIALAAVSLLVIGLLVPSPFNARFQSIFNLNEGSNRGRLENWSQALEVIYSHPLIGVGIGNYPLEIKPAADYRDPIYAHSAYLDIAAETGAVNALVFTGLIFSAGVIFYLRSRKDIFYLGFLLGLVIFAIHSLVETPIYSPTVLALFLIIIGFAGGKEEKYEKN